MVVSLPHFFQNDDRAESRGYIEHSYLDGLSPTSFYFQHNMASRLDLLTQLLRLKTLVIYLEN